MANPIHLELLLRGANVWNDWKLRQHEAQPEFSADLSDCDLRGRDLSNVDLSYVDLTCSNLQGTRLKDTLIEYAILRGACLDEVDLRNTGLRGSDLRNATLRKANFQGIENFRIWEANFEHADLSEANLSYADFGDEEILDPKLEGKQLTRAEETQALVTGRFAVPGYSHGPAFIEFNHGANLCHVILRDANLIGVRLRGVFIREADLRRANISGGDLFDCSLEGSDLRAAIMHRANLYKASLQGARLGGVDLSCALLSSADLRCANLEQTNLQEAILVNTNLAGANLTGAAVYGLSSWNIQLEGAIQEGLIITPDGEPVVRVSDLEIAQFLYLVLNREKIRNIIESMTSQAVLLLGRFGGGGLEVLRQLSEELRRLNYVPMIFDFERPRDRNYTETVKTLAGLSRFVVVDLSGPSVPQELYATVPHLKIPFVPILEKGKNPYSMFADILEYDWVLKPIVEYDTVGALIETLALRVVKPAEARIQQRQAVLRDLFGTRSGCAMTPDKG